MGASSPTGVVTGRGVVGLANPTLAVLGLPLLNVHRVLGDRLKVAEEGDNAAAGDCLGLLRERKRVGVTIGVTRTVSADFLLLAADETILR